MAAGPNQDNSGIDGDWIAVGAFGAPHGVRGAVKLRSFTEVAAAVFGFKEIHKGPGGPVLRLKKQSTSKGGFVVQIEGIDTPELAATLSGQQLFVHRNFLPAADEDEFYLADLIGLEARDVAGVRIGAVSAVENFGAEDLLELALDEPVKGLGRYALVPFRSELVPDVNIGDGFLSVDMDHWQQIQAGKTAESQTDQEDKS